MSLGFVPITPGSGSNIYTDSISGGVVQVVKFDVGAVGSSALVTAGGTNYLPIAIQSIAGGVQFTIVPAASQTFPVVNAPTTTLAISAASAIPVSAPVGTPVFVRLSDGTNPISTLPVSGTVTANQGTAGSAWPFVLQDGSSHTAAFTNYTGSLYALNVAVVSSVGAGGTAADSSAFTAGSTTIGIVGGVYNDSLTQPTSGQAAALRMTQNRAVHVNLRTAAGTEIGTSGSPVRTDPTGTTTQPVSGTVNAQVTQIGGNNVSTVASGVQKVGIADGSGNVFSETNAIPVYATGKQKTRISKTVSLTASQTAQVVWTPGSGKLYFLTYITLVVTTAGNLKLFDNTDSASTRLFDSGAVNFPTGVFNFDFNANPWPASAINNVLEYTSGSGLVAQITLHGYEE